LAIKTDGTLWAWGWNGYGQLGLGDTTNRLTPTQVGTDTDWIHVEGGFCHIIGEKSDGRLFGWGCNFAGQLGLGNTSTAVTSPTQFQ